MQRGRQPAPGSDPLVPASRGRALRPAQRGRVADMTIRVLIVDDQPLVRTGLGIVLQAASDLKVAGEAADGEQAVRTCPEGSSHATGQCRTSARPPPARSRRGPSSELPGTPQAAPFRRELGAFPAGIAAPSRTGVAHLANLQASGAWVTGGKAPRAVERLGGFSVAGHPHPKRMANTGRSPRWPHDLAFDGAQHPIKSN